MFFSLGRSSASTRRKSRSERDALTALWKSSTTSGGLDLQSNFFGCPVLSTQARTFGDDVVASPW